MGDSDLFSLEMPGSLASKKSNTDILDGTSSDDTSPLDRYRDSPMGSRSPLDEPMKYGSRSPGLNREMRRRKLSSGLDYSEEYVTEEPGYMSPDENTSEEGVPRRGHLGSFPEASLSNTSLEYLEDRNFVADFLRGYHCISMMPQSSKVVVLDTGISIRAAFQALEENDIESAPLWDSNEHDYTGIITIGDLLAELLVAVQTTEPNNPNLVLKKLENTKIRNMAKPRADLIAVEPSDSLYEACSIMSRFKVHRVPVIDRIEQNTILFVLTATRIVVFLMKIMTKRPALFEVSLESLQIGRFGNLTVTTPTATLLELVQLINKKHFAAVPIVDENGILVDTLYKSDLARIPPSDLLELLSKPVVEVLNCLRERNVLKSAGPNTCTIDETLEVILARMMDWKLRSLVVIDTDRTVKGIISLGDLLRLFVV